MTLIVGARAKSSHDALSGIPAPNGYAQIRFSKWSIFTADDPYPPYLYQKPARHSATAVSEDDDFEILPIDIMTATLESMHSPQLKERSALFNPQSSSPIFSNSEMEVESRGRRHAASISSPIRTDEPDPRQSLQHVLAAAEPAPRYRRPPETPVVTKSGTAPKGGIIWIQEGGKEQAEDETSVQNDSYTRAAEVNPSHTMTVAHTRRNANGTIGSVYSGNKIRHLKKEDGIPLWRRDIQFAFLRCVFEDKTPVFTMASDGSKGYTFADIYIDAMARSSKTSRILKDKLTTDRTAALNMAMVCLLVNVGRMNTTLNFFPEMRAQLRTYHSIPSLQAHQDPNAYKQLQDAPRLKSILKGASEDMHQPSTIERIKAFPIPRTNPVNLIFVLSQYAPKISETHFFPPRDFFDLVMRGTLSSRSRAKAFLWLIWYYLESDFSGQAAENNPFGRGQHGDATGGLPLKVPPFEHLTEEQANAENVDTESEKAYGEMKRQERKRILEEDETVGPPMKRGKKGQNSMADEGGPLLLSDTDHTPSPPPPPMLVVPSKPMEDRYESKEVTINGKIDDTPSIIRHDNGRNVGDRHESSNPQRIIFKTRMDHIPNLSPTAAPGLSHPVLHTGNLNNASQRRPRPETSHQKAVNMNRKMRIDHILHQQISVEHSIARRRKREESSSFGFTAMKRIKDLPDDYDTEDERAERTWGPGGLLPNPDETEDFGAEALSQKKSIDRAIRRLARDEVGGTLGGLVKGYRRRKRKAKGYAEDEEAAERLSRKRLKHSDNQGTRMDRSRDGERHEEGLDDLDLDLLGESRDDDQMTDDDSGMEDSEGEGEDASEEDAMIED